FSVRQCRARRDRTRNGVDLAIELRQTVDIDRHVVQIALLAAQERDDSTNRPLHMCRGICFPRAGKTTQETRPGRCFRPVVNLHAGDAALVPHNSARTDRGVEYRETVAHSVTIARALRRRRPIPGPLSSRCAAASGWA